MGNKPHVVVSIQSQAERSLLRFYLSSSPTPNTSVEANQGLAGYVGKKPQLLVCDQEPGETVALSAARMRRAFPQALVVLVIDAAGPSAAVPGAPDVALDAVLVRPMTLERLDSVLSPIMRRAALPARPRVLVVDDDPEVLHFVEAVLGKAGCEVTAVSDPQRYLARPNAPEFDLALLDVVMPEVDGLQICLRLRATGREDLRICMMSAAHDPETERKADLYGADEFVPKPLHVRELHALIGRTRLHSGRRLPGGVALRSVEPPAPRRTGSVRVDDRDT